jgi:hypothetical protein
MRKAHFNGEFLVLLGPIVSRLFTCSNEIKKLKTKTKGACSSPISMVITMDILFRGFLWLLLPVPAELFHPFVLDVYESDVS